MIKSFAELYDKIDGRKPIPLAIANAMNDHVLKAIDEAQSRGWIEPLIFNHADPRCAARMAVDAVRNGSARMLMKGDLDSATLLKEILDRTAGITGEGYLSHLAAVEMPGRSGFMLWTDGGVTIQLNETTLKSIIQNSLAAAHSLGNARPKIALLALVETVTEKLAETVLADWAVRAFQDRKDLVIEGPIALDVALSREAADKKNLVSRISGKTDIFVGPSITAVNHVVKALAGLAGARVGGLVLGAKVPVVLLSRSDSAETKLNSIALGLINVTGER